MKETARSFPDAEMNPRQKDSQGLDFWATSLLENNLISKREYDEFIEKNNSKEKMMEERRLPQLKHYGEFTSTEQIRKKIRPQEEEKFIIRCTSKKNGEIKRLIDANLDEVCDFADKLPGGFEYWDVEVKEFVKSIAAGTIIVSPNGRTIIETWHGPHYLNTTNVPKYHAEFDPDQFHMHFNWKGPEEARDLPEMQNYALKALRYFFRHLKPRENEPIYAEYGVKASGEIYFIEANDSSLLTGK